MQKPTDRAPTAGTRGLSTAMAVFALALLLGTVACNNSGLPHNVPKEFADQFPQLLDMGVPPRGTEKEKREFLRRAYAQSCRAEVGYIEEFNCARGVEVEVYGHRGIESQSKITVPNTKTDCRNPAFLLDVATPCMPGTRILKLRSSNPEASIVALCRKYSKEKDVLPALKDNEYNDIGIIAHNPKTGATCFFQSWTSKGPLNGTAVPSPMSNSDAAAQFYVPPKLGLAGEKQYNYTGYDCTNCHDADPFIVSPFLAKQIMAMGVLNPKGAYDVNVGGPWSPPSDFIGITEDSHKLPGMAASQCDDCHRLGGGSLNAFRKYGFAYKLDPASMEVVLNLHGFMPLGNNNSAADWNGKFGQAIADLYACLRTTKPPPGCTRQQKGVATAEPVG